MKYIKNFKIYESSESELADDDKVDKDKYKEVLDEIKSMIESTIERSGGEFNSFVESYIKDSESVKIEGLINESDIYEFYLKFRNQIDELLNDIKFYDTPASELSSYGLYDFLIKGTLKSIDEFVKMFIE